MHSFDTIIFDIGDVLFSWSSKTETSISSKTLRNILSSSTWMDYERGKVTEQDCYDRVGVEFSLDPAEIRKAFDQARDSLQSDNEMISLIRELKANSRGRLRVFAMSNISLPDYDVLQTKPADWSLFDRVFTSGAVGERKPHLGFYRHVLAETKADPHSSIFVDDKPENVLTARSLGLHGIIFDDRSRVTRALRNLLSDPVSRGREYLSSNAKRLESRTDGGIVLEENFAQLLILEATGDRSLVNLVEHPRLWNFFQGKGQLTTKDFPCDLDTTSLGLTVLKHDRELIESIIDETLNYMDSDGIIQTYYDHSRPRFDPIVCVNVLSLFYSYGRSAHLKQTLAWVHEVLLNRAYLDGTRYYATAECFLYFVGRLLQKSGDADLHALLKPLLKERVQERIGVQGDSLALAMRILVCDYVGIRDDVDLRVLLPLQCEDGGWEIGWMYKYGSSGICIGNRGLTTALAIKAIECLVSPPPSPTPTLVESSLPTKTRSKSKQRRNSSLKESFSWLVNGGRLRSLSASAATVQVGC
ncbi:Haloacid dehalogenase-like hydrolase-domain-containing protein [Desarmillaria tabescens]|uniref:Haloacid dehalogenase-like hydrolase-domain-containing protein n=1 Tax=Armillaria tabescens TaxID=1929756 RepID=A0AA39N8M3_ARMTA|nr:Haloacid dehalogenase-like hydrolase-domain-containing protein [Desarmillaria tabescens]KAK0461065.1 Haloacid dehalogenase-like hydrolase-domain-containing protein [Desarmillaria tabescens]